MIDLLIVISLWCAQGEVTANCKINLTNCMELETRLPRPEKVLKCLKEGDKDKD
jgi:hypothetical protein